MVKERHCLTNIAINLIRNVLRCVLSTICHWHEEKKKNVIMQKNQKQTSNHFLTFSAHCQTFFAQLYQIPLSLSSLSSLAVFLLLSVLPTSPLSDPYTPPFSHLLSSVYHSINPPISAQWGLALFLSDVWKCPQCEGTGVWGGAHAAYEDVESLWPLRLTERQTQDNGLYWACLSWPPGTSQPLLHLTLGFFLFFLELPPGWEKIDDPVYGVYYVE